MHCLYISFAWARRENALFSRFTGNINKQRQNFIFFLNLDMVPRNSTLAGLAYIWRSRWVGIIEIAKMVVVTETRLEYQKLNIICNFERERAWPSLLPYNIRVSFNFLVKESKIKLSGCLFFQNTLKKLNQMSPSYVIFLLFESRGLGDCKGLKSRLYFSTN